MVTIREAVTDEDWARGCALLQQVYVGDGFTPADRAAEFMRRERLEQEGAFLLAIQDTGETIGAVLFLHEGSQLHQVALPGEREFRLLAVRSDARSEGVGHALVHGCLMRAAADDALGLVLWTQPTMLAAHRLYERLGFVHETARDEEDPRGFTRLVYVKRL
ncbi:MAG: GNAT family N-acetyltransferase [Flavobacteriales bacterium]|nr:GNAT family N-acetyltransferase [Flavobacteriales bacterium]